MPTLRIATRGSLLALRQTEQVGRAIERRCGAAVELVALVTRGDRRAGPLAPVGGKGLFTAELEEALLAGKVDLAVHSAKDVPAAMGGELAIVAVPPRQDARDAVVSRQGGLADLSRGARVGTGSPRRRAQLLAARGDLAVVAVRGNVDTRLRKALDEAGKLDAVVLAMAGLIRSGLAGQCGRFIHPLAVEQCIPAAGQGLLIVQATAARAGELGGLLAPLDDPPSRQALDAERHVVRRLGAGCRSCLAVHVAPDGPGWLAAAMAARPDGSGMLRLAERADTAVAAAEALANALLAAGAEKLFADNAAGEA